MTHTIELFSGTGSFSKVAKKLGHSILTIDNSPDADVITEGRHRQEDLTDWFTDKNPRPMDGEGIPPILWASPPCQGFSVASIGKHWKKMPDGNHQVKHPTALRGLQVLNSAVRLIREIDACYWFIENPRAMMRKVIDKRFRAHGFNDYVRHTVTYCQYGDTRMKPTDIWTNAHWWKPKQPCKNGMPCHVAAPRGSKTGTQGIKGAKARGAIPPQLFEEIFDHYEGAHINSVDGKLSTRKN